MHYLSQKSFEPGTICLVRLGLDISNNELDTSPRISNALHTLRYLLRQKCRIVILSHRGRPDPEQIKHVSHKRHYTLKPVSKRLSRSLRREIIFESDSDFKVLSKRISKLPNQSVVMLENVRFLKGEKENSAVLSKQYASLGDVYINDAFSVAHRKETSIVGIAKRLPSFAGLHMEQEIKELSGVVKKPKKPLVIILGGAKISDKVSVIEAFADRARILVGGAIATTFFAARSIPVGSSLYEKDALSQARRWMDHPSIVLPDDVVVDDNSIYDIGSRTIDYYCDIISKAGTIVWNGPMGYIENKKFAVGTDAIARAIAKSKARSIVGGGETATFVVNRNLGRKFSFVSSGGGAMLEYLANHSLPGIKALG